MTAKYRDSVNDRSKRQPPATTPEGRENQMISIAMDLAEKKLRDGTASSQLITEFVKRGSVKERIEKEILEKQKELITAKTEAIKSQKRIEELYSNALAAMRAYSGSANEPSGDDYED